MCIAEQISAGDMMMVADLGVTETEANIRNKIARGGFSAVFFMQCLVAMGAHTIYLRMD